jgi:hypothetical protein
MYERPRGVAKLTQEEKEALVDRSEYQPKSGVPEHYDERFEATCRLCGREVTVTLNSLYSADKDRAWKVPYGESGRREKCYHPKVTLPARQPRKYRTNPGPINPEDARALLAALGPQADNADRITRRAYKRLRYIAQEEGQ